jgi:hypothetical protein
MGVHFRLEETNGRSAGAFGAIKRAIRALEQLVGFGAVIRRYRYSNSNTEIRCRAIDHERFGDSSGYAPREVCRLIE